MHKPTRSDSSRTIPRSFRISHTHNSLLDGDVYKEKASALVRALLTLYFNKKLPTTLVESAMTADIEETKRIMDSRLTAFNLSVKLLKERKG